MQRFFILLFTFSLLFSHVRAQKVNAKEFSFSGKVINAETGEAIEIATIILNKSVGTLTDWKGEFKINNLKGGDYTYTVSSLGFKEVTGLVHIDRNIENKVIKMSSLSIGLEEVVVTATSSAMGSSSKISETAIQHIQPKSVDDMLQLLPGGLSKNPNLNKLGQANIREIGSNDNNALGTAIIVDGAPLSNDGNLQALSTNISGAASGKGMSEQTTSGKGVDMRTISPDNVESMEVIRGIPSAEYGNLTSGIVIVKTKAGVTPLEVKVKVDPFSKMAYAGKGFALKGGGAVNLGIDWSQSFGDTRKRYLGYDRVTASAGYSNGFYLAGKPLSFNFRGAFYSNINNSKEDPQMNITNDTYRNKNIGTRLNLEGDWKLDNPFLSAIGYSLMFSAAHQQDIMHEYVASSNGVITNTFEPGIHEGIFLPNSYYADYKIDGKPINLFGLIKANKMISFTNESYTNLKAGVDWRYDYNNGHGLIYDVNMPPQNTSSQALRPRSFKDIPAMNNLSGFIEDKTYLNLWNTYLTFQGGVRMSNLFMDQKLAKQKNLFMVEPRLNLSYEILNKKNNSFFDELSIYGGWGISYKAPTLIYLYPEDAYFDKASLSKVSNTDPSGSLAVMTTDVLTNLANPNLKPAKSVKAEGGISFRHNKVKGMVTFFSEKHSNEFGFTASPHYLQFNRYVVPTGATDLKLNGTEVTYTNELNQTVVAAKEADTLITTYYSPVNKMATQKRGIEYTLDLGYFTPLRTSLIMDGAWFYIKRTNMQSYYSAIDDVYPYIKLMPAGSGTIQNRINTNFRFITHIPALKLIFSTTMQVVWYESEQNIWKDKGENLFYASDDNQFMLMAPLGFYDKKGNYTAWKKEFANRPEYDRMITKTLRTYYDKEVYKPWVMFNFRLTKEIGKILDLSFTANNFTNTSRWHYYKRQQGYRQIYPDLYFGAELRIKINP